MRTLIAMLIGVIVAAGANLVDDRAVVAVAVFYLTALTLLIVVINFISVFQTRNRVGLLFFAVGCLFWYWSEACALALGFPMFANIAGFSPILGLEVPTWVVAKATLCCSLFMFFGYWTWYLLPSSFSVDRLILTKPYPFKARYSIDVVLMLFALSGWLPLIFTYGSPEAAIAQLLTMRSDPALDQEAGFANYLPIASLVAASISAVRILFRSNGSVLLRILAVIAGGALVIASGTRFKLIYLIMPAIVLLLTDKSSFFSKRQRARYLLGALVLLFFVASYQFVNRYGEGSVDEAANVSGAVSGAGHFTALMHAVYLVPNEAGYFYQPMGPFFVTDYIPRFIWSDKPVHKFWEFYNDRLAVYTGGNITPSSVGQYYMNWGVMGAALIGVVLGAWVKLADNSLLNVVVRKDDLAASVVAFLIVFVFLSFRVYSPMYFAYPLFAYLMFRLLRFVFR